MRSRRNGIVKSAGVDLTCARVTASPSHRPGLLPVDGNSPA